VLYRCVHRHHVQGIAVGFAVELHSGRTFLGNFRALSLVGLGGLRAVMGLPSIYRPEAIAVLMSISVGEAKY